jgi:hypothetical protein
MGEVLSGTLQTPSKACGVMSVSNITIIQTPNR